MSANRVVEKEEAPTISTEWEAKAEDAPPINQNSVVVMTR